MMGNCFMLVKDKNKLFEHGGRVNLERMSLPVKSIWTSLLIFLLILYGSRRKSKMRFVHVAYKRIRCDVITTHFTDTYQL